MKFIFLARYLYFNEITILAHLTNAEWSGPLSPLDYLVYRMFTISSNCYWVLDKKSHMYVFIIPTKCVAAYKYLERGGKFYSRVLSKHMYENIDKVWWQALKLSRKSGLDNESYAVFFLKFHHTLDYGLEFKMPPVWPQLNKLLIMDFPWWFSNCSNRHLQRRSLRPYSLLRP